MSYNAYEKKKPTIKEKLASIVKNLALASGVWCLLLTFVLLLVEPAQYYGILVALFTVYNTVTIMVHNKSFTAKFANCVLGLFLVAYQVYVLNVTVFDKGIIVAIGLAYTPVLLSVLVVPVNAIIRPRKKKYYTNNRKNNTRR